MALISGEFFGRYKARNRVMLRRRLQILSDRQKIDFRRAQIVHYLKHFGLVLAESNHNPRLCKQGRVQPLDLVEQAQRVKVSRAWSYLGVKSGCGFEIVIEHVGPRRDDG